MITLGLLNSNDLPVSNVIWTVKYSLPVRQAFAHSAGGFNFPDLDDTDYSDKNMHSMVELRIRSRP